MTCKLRRCPDCDDTLIHQNNRKKDESSSGFSQYVYGIRPHTFYYADVDGNIYKMSNGFFADIEHKNLGGKLSKGQETILPLRARGIEGLIEQGYVSENSGVCVSCAV